MTLGPGQLTSSRFWDLVIVGLASAVAGMLVAWPFKDLSFGGDHYVYLAHSFARGSLAVDALPPHYSDYVPWNGHKYLPFGPLPAVLLIPLLPLLLAGVPLVAASYALTALNVLLLFRVLRRAQIDGERRLWIVLLFFAGTTYLSITWTGISTYFAHVVVTTFLLLALAEFLGVRRVILVGLYVGLAASARLTALFSLTFFLWMLAAEEKGGLRRRARVARAGGLLAGFSLPVSLLMAYNFVRFGSIVETGFGSADLYVPVLEQARSAGLFSIVHVPKNLFMLLLQGPVPAGGETAAVLRFPYFEPSPWGMGLFFTSPALAYAFRTSMRDRFNQACWLAIAATLVPLLTYYGIGYVQFGYRYALDFMPFLVLLASRGFPSNPTNTARWAVVASVVICIWGSIMLAIRL